MGGIFSFLKGIPFIGGLFGLLSGAKGMIVPSAQHGMVSGGVGGTLALLHPREMVLPSQISNFIIQSAATGIRSSSPGSSVNLNYSPTIGSGNQLSRAELSQILRGHSATLAGLARNMTRPGGGGMRI